jgi:hypothetical protein
LAVVCKNVVDRVPAGIAERFPAGTRQVSYFTHITGVNDTNVTVKHRWYHEGRLVQTTILTIRSPSWRTHSRRNLANLPAAETAGNWRVELVETATGRVLETSSFVIE